MSRDDEKFVNSIKEQLDRQTEALDRETLSRLFQARTAAQVEAVGPQRRHWQPTAAFVAIAVLSVVLWMAMPVNNHGEQTIAALDDMELLAAVDEPEFYEEIEFYQWLEARDEQG